MDLLFTPIFQSGLSINVEASEFTVMLLDLNCFHPWCPDGWAMRKSLSGLYLCKV